MTSTGAGPERSPWPFAAWVMVGLTVIALTVAVAGKILSPSVVLDALALWPLAALVVPAALLGFSGGRRRALAPLVLLSWMLMTVGLHLSRFEGLPSSAAAVSADLGEASTGRLVAAVPEVELRVGSGPFTVAPLPGGGDGGVPVVERVSGGSSVSLTLTDDQERSVWFRFGVFDITLPADVSWDLTLEGATIDADLSALDVTALAMTAPHGTVTLGAPSGPASVAIDGDFDLSVPDGAAVTVTGAGTATVPADWTVEDGTATTGSGDGWMIVVRSGTVRITTR